MRPALEPQDEVMSRLRGRTDAQAGDDDVDVARRPGVTEGMQQPQAEDPARDHRERGREAEADRRPPWPQARVGGGVAAERPDGVQGLEDAFAGPGPPE